MRSNIEGPQGLKNRKRATWTVIHTIGGGVDKCFQFDPKAPITFRILLSPALLKPNAQARNELPSTSAAKAMRKAPATDMQ